MCPAITMLDSNLNICQDCIGGKYTNCIRKKCIKKSKLKSLLGAIEGYYYRTKKIYTNKIDAIITPSYFLKEKLVQDGIPEDKIEVIYNFIDTLKYDGQVEDEGYALYFGRLSKEKGILNLIEAFAKTSKGTLYIAGEGEQKSKVEEKIKENNLQHRVKLLGLLSKEKMKQTIEKCRFVVVPSIWYENCPYSIIEALTIGKPVIGADIGGIPELIKNNENGFTYPYDDVEELAKKMEQLFEDKELVKRMGKQAKQYAKKQYAKEEYYDQIMKIYQKVAKGGK